jgi:hypothetical protein
MANESLTWTVGEVLKRVPELGIPHFQRGLVWGEDSQAALLESLFYDTPCGSFVLWQPENCEAQGVALDAASNRPMRYLVIDGQQRIRSLHSVFGRANETQTWCLNLAALPEFARKADPLQRELSLFVLTKDPALRTEAERRSPAARNLLPLRTIEAAALWTNPSLDPYRPLITLDSAAVERVFPALYKGVAAIQSRRFFVSIQRDAELADMVNLYNRINSGGKRVEVEERAFARLVGLQPETFKDLKAAFDEVHGEANKASAIVDPTELERDSVLRRQKERAFGFKLFVRVFLQVCQHHLGFPQGRTEFSFELAEKASFIAAFGGLEAPQADALWQEARRVLRHVRSVLREPLFADDLRFLPDTSALLPVFQLLIHYPRLDEKRYRPLLAALILRLMLAELDSRRLLELVTVAGDPHQVAMRAIPKMLALLKDRMTPATLAGRLQYANSIQSRYVLLLYWVERSLGARDFRYAHVPMPHALKGEEPKLTEGVEPEKQHLLPFIKAQKLYGGELRRGGSHVVNSIGNLTYISRAQNDFDGGLGDRLARLDLEDRDNQQAHLMLDALRGDRVLADYDALRKKFEKNDPGSIASSRGTFERMVRRRREIVGSAFEAWLGRLDNAACTALGIADLAELPVLAEHADRLEPAAPWYAKFASSNMAHWIRGLGYSNLEEDRLIALARRARAKPAWQEGKPPYRLQLTRLKRIWVKLNPPEVVLRLDPSLPASVRERVFEALGLAPSGENTIRLSPVPSFEVLLDRIPEIEKQLASAAKPS